LHTANRIHVLTRIGDNTHWRGKADPRTPGTAPGRRVDFHADARCGGALRFAKVYRGYSTEQLNSIIKAGGGLRQGKSQQELKSALGEAILAAQIHAGIRRWETAPPARAGEFEKVRRASERLLKLLGVATDGKPHVAPKLRGGALSGLQGQGFGWAQHWFKAVEREKRVAVLRRSRERKLTTQGRDSEADALRAAREGRREARAEKRERWRRQHGGWPADHEFPRVFETSEGNRSLVFGEDLALIAAVEGVQRLRTWAALEAKRLSKSLPSESGGKSGSRDVPMRHSHTYFVGRLALLYPRFFKREQFGVSKSALSSKNGKPAGSVGGPGIRFVQACFGPLGITMTAEAIEKAWDTCRADSKRHMGNRPRK
jgi:hypothetical protein